jgi:hypothetical protein
MTMDAGRRDDIAGRSHFLAGKAKNRRLRSIHMTARRITRTRRFPGLTAALLASLLTALSACGHDHKSKGSSTSPRISGFSASSSSVRAGRPAVLLASFANGTGTVDHGVGAVTSGVAIPTELITETTIFTLTVTGGGETVTATATVTVTPPERRDGTDLNGTVLVVQRATTGALEPVPGVAIHRNDPDSGAYIDSRTTGADGVADFGDLTGQRVTLSIVQPSTSDDGETHVISFVDVPSRPIMIRWDRLHQGGDQIATVDVTTVPESSFSLVILPSGWTFDGESVSIRRDDLQLDGRVSMIVANASGEGEWECGSLTDLDVSELGASLSAQTASNLVEYSFHSSEAIAPDLRVLRKDAWFVEPRWGDGETHYYQDVRMWSSVACLQGIERYALLGNTASTMSTVSDEKADTYTSRYKILGLSLQELPTEKMAIDVSNLEIADFSHDSGTLHASLSAAGGAQVPDVVQATILVQLPTYPYDELQWQVVAPPSRLLDSLHPLKLPDLPGVELPSRIDHIFTDVAVYDVAEVSGFDDFWDLVRTTGSFSHSLLINGYDGAAARAHSETKVPPSYQITLDYQDPLAPMEAVYCRLAMGYCTWMRGGRIHSDDGSLDCGGSEGWNKCRASFQVGTTVQLTATANSGGGFWTWGNGELADPPSGQTAPTSWSADVTITDHDISLSPKFSSSYRNGNMSLSVAIGGGDVQGLITSDDGLIYYGWDSKGTFYDDSYWNWYGGGWGVTLTATPSAAVGAFEVNWSGEGCSGTGDSVYVVMDRNRQCTATFTALPPP